MEAVAKLEVSVQYPSGEAFALHKGSAFHASADDGSGADLELAEVELSPGKRYTSDDAPPSSPFSLMFIGPAEPVLPQRIYAMQHAALGTLDIFIVPLGPHPQNKKMRYQAIFN